MEVKAFGSLWNASKVCSNMSTIAIIPARGGSKGIPGKNIIDFCGHPLIAWTIAAARRCDAIDEVYVSTDAEDIATTSRRYGAKVMARPVEIAGDLATSESALIHVAQEIERRSGAAPARVVFLQATSPLRESAELDGALAKFDAEGLDSLFSASLPEDMLFWQKTESGYHSINYDFASRKRRQDMSEESLLLVETGSFYIMRMSLLRETENRLGGRIGTWPVAFWKSFEIDSGEGLELCTLLMRQNGLDRQPPEFAALSE
jgi:CMP-N,N'-diacetyllegionaminic acid synthase